MRQFNNLLIHVLLVSAAITLAAVVLTVPPLGRHLHAVFDDRPCVVRLWRSRGLFVFDCGNGVEF